MREQILHMPSDPAIPVTLEATLFEPPGDGPFPLAVMNHGADGDPRAAHRYRVSFAIDYLLSRGYAVVAPMMRGFSNSGGVAANVGCDVARVGKLNARDILAVIGEMKSRPEIDGSRILVMGQSFGGWNSLAVATMAPPAVKGVVNFVGGLRESNCNRQDAAMSKGMEQLGRESRVPSLWFYGERDALFPEKVWRADYERFTKAGGKARLIDFGNVDDAHNLLGHGERLDLWIPQVDAYLAERGLPNREIYPEYLPTPRPPKTNYALIDDVATAPFIGRTHPEFYQKFLNNNVRPRAIVVGPHSASVQTGGFDPVARAMDECGKQGGPCWLYAYDEDVVWTGPAPGQTARINGISIVGKAAKAGEAVEVQRVTAMTPACEPLPLPTLSIASPPAHGAADVAMTNESPQFVPQNPLAACNTHNVPVLRLSYKSSPDFIGVDFFSVVITIEGKPPQTVTFAVHVR